LKTQPWIFKLAVLFFEEARRSHRGGFFVSRGFAPIMRFRSLLMKTLVAIFLLGMRIAVAQTAPADDAQQTTSFRTQSNLVLVPTLVRDKSGKPVFALPVKDFTVTDNGVEQKISLEDDTDSQPLALVVAVETGASGAGQLANYRTLEPLIEALVGGVEHQVAVVDFDSTPHLTEPFTDNWEKIGNALSSVPPGDPEAAILDALSFSVDLLKKQPPTYRRAILLLSETQDRNSHTSVAETVRAVSNTNTIIYSLAFSSTKTNFKGNGKRILKDDKPGPPHGCMGKDPADPDQNKALQAWNCLGLLVPPLRVAQLAVMLGVDSMRRNVPESVANLTGGEYYKFNNPKSLDKSLETIAHYVPNRYVLSFRPQAPTPGPHALEVKLKDYSGLEITARKTYWVDGGESPTAPAPK
jgi:VWFA-related protein